jgi:hypothetical protein
MTSNPALTQVDTGDAFYAIEHVAALFQIKVDTPAATSHGRVPPQSHGPQQDR